MKIITLLALMLWPVSSALGQDITGAWNGVLEVQGNRLRLTFRVEQTDSGYAATLDSPDQNATGIRIASTVFEPPALTFRMPNLGAVYEGTLSGSSITGAWRQGVTSVPLVLSRDSAGMEPPARPQEPRRPYPYREEAVSFENRGADVVLAGTLTLPDGAGPHPAVVLISGSGPQDRDETVFGHKPFLVLADHLTRHGIAVLRYDDRGFGQSTGTFRSATSADFATDASSAVEYLTTRADIDRGNIGLIGHSEGGIIAPMVAVLSDDVAHIVLLAAIGIPGKEVSLMQSSSLRAFDVPDEEAYARFARRTIEIASSSEPLPAKRAHLRRHYESIETVLASMLPKDIDVNTYIAQQVAVETSPWNQFFLRYDPAVDLEKVEVPVLSLNGSNDVQVPAEVNQAAIRQALERGGNRDYVIMELPGLNHMFQESTTGAMNEYPQIEQTFSPRALTEITTWIKAQQSR